MGHEVGRSHLLHKLGIHHPASFLVKAFRFHQKLLVAGANKPQKGQEWYNLEAFYEYHV